MITFNAMARANEETKQNILGLCTSPNTYFMKSIIGSSPKRDATLADRTRHADPLTAVVYSATDVTIELYSANEECSGRCLLDSLDISDSNVLDMVA
ncbi:hypothetical protein AB6A40_004822 [Gnathostoma spinigerum]|uniref:Uncharacterized protein n=1 Tax=Gnathostoma spinigerum TaxID=75299 RepID=A0ABD6EDN2_9BILA